MNDTDTRVNWREMTAAELDLEIARRLGLPMDEPSKHLFYTTDLNAAANLPIDDVYHWEIRVYLEGIANAGIIPNAFFDVKEHREDADTEALARCKAWLAWHAAKSDKLSPSDTD